MTKGCKIDKQDSAYFLTFTVVDWIALFDEDRFKNIICESLNYCTDKKGLVIYVYVIMNTHLHLIATSGFANLSGTVRDFKKYTSGIITDMLENDRNGRSAAILDIFANAAGKHSRNKKFQVWQQHSHPEEVYSPKFTLSKIKYIHNNPVEAGLVNFPQDYL
jgi:REP element-mobilizing transposase RayT